MSTLDLLVIISVVAMVLLATVPFVHRYRQRRDGAAPDRSADGIGNRAVHRRPTPTDAHDVPAVAPSVESQPATYSTGLAVSRRSLRERLSPIRGRSADDDDVWERIEEALLGADVGVATTMATLDRLRATSVDQGITDGDMLVESLGAQMRAALGAERSLQTTAPDRPGATPVWLFVGVNGVGKTTTIGKVGHRLAAQQRRVVMAAGDTFRAAATEQLGTWATRCGAELISGSPGADPSSVVHDAVAAAAARGADIVLADTAGRLQNRKNLMDELAKVRRVADRDPGAVTETLLVIDATTGQNGLSQARAFAESTDVTGVVLTKLDGSAKGGIVFAIEAELGLPVKLVGLGEGAADLIDFDPDDYVEALLASPTDHTR